MVSILIPCTILSSMYNIRSKEVCSEHSHVQAFKHGNYKIIFFAVIDYWNDWKWEGDSKVEDCVKILVSCEDGIEKAGIVNCHRKPRNN